MLTALDFQKIEELLDRKLDEKLDKRLKEFSLTMWQGIEKYLEVRLEPYERMRVDFYSFKDRMEKNMDWIISKIQKFDESFTIWNARYPQIFSKLDNHEKRIIKLEKSN